MRGLEGEDEMYARTLISPSWRMRGRIAIDAMIFTGAETDDDSENGRWEGGEERQGGDDGGQKPTWRTRVLVGGF